MSRKLFLTGLLLFNLVGLGILPAGAQMAASVTMHLDGRGSYFKDEASVGDPNVPAMTAIGAGGTVIWTNATGSHTVTTEAVLSGGPPAAPCGTGDNFDSGLIIALGATFSHTFMTPGICTYYCSVHNSLMQGQVEIMPVATTTTISTTTTTRPTTTTTTTTLPNHPPSAVSLTPVNITTVPSVAQSFTAVYSDPDGYQNIADTSLLLSGTTHNELVQFNPLTNKFTIMGVGGNCSPGQAATLSNAYLTLNCSTSSVSGSGAMWTVVYNLTPQPPLSGTAYLLIIAVTDQGSLSNNKTTGTWTVNRPPSADSCNPMNSSTPPGTAQTFVCVYSDPDGWQNIAAANFYLSGNGGAHNEWLHYLGAPNLFTMLGTNDVCSPGQAATLSNGFLNLDCSLSSISGSGTMLTVTFRVTPQAPSSGIQYNNFSAASDQAGAAYAIFAGAWQIQ